MNANLLLPDEFDILPDAFENPVLSADAHGVAGETPFKIARKCWNTGDISAYRAAYIVAHRLNSWAGIVMLAGPETTEETQNKSHRPPGKG